MKLAEELGRSRDEVSSHHHKVERPQRAGGGSAGAPGLPRGARAGKDRWCWERLEIKLEATCTGRLEVQADRRLCNPGRILGKAWEGA